MRRFHALGWHKFELSVKLQENPSIRSGDMAVTGERKEEPTQERTNGTTINGPRGHIFYTLHGDRGGATTH